MAGDGATIPPDLAEDDATMLARLHATAPPPGISAWHPLVAATFADRLEARLADPWPTDPYGEGGGPVRQRWVVTHGEPHAGNQLRTGAGVVLVDWEGVILAPRERDLRPLVGSGYANLVDPDPAMLELFDLEWRLDEIDQNAEWFGRSHAGTESDVVAYVGLVEERDRPDWSARA